MYLPKQEKRKHYHCISSEVSTRGITTQVFPTAFVHLEPYTRFYHLYYQC